MRGGAVRPGSSKYDLNILSEIILKRVAEGDPILRVCAEPGMPSIVTVNRWLQTPEFRRRLEQAKALGKATFQRS